MRGITPVIAIILLLLITISMVGFAFMFFTRTAQTSAESGEEQLRQQLQQAGGQFSIEGISTQGEIYVRNRGSGLLANFSVFVDNSPVQFQQTAINPGSVGPVKITDLTSLFRSGTHTIKVCTISACYTTNYENALNNGLLMYLPFSEGSGTIAGDISGNGNNGTIIGAAWTTGKSGSGLDFNGINNYVDISTVRMSENAGTITAWVKTRASSTDTVVIGYHLGLRTYIQWIKSGNNYRVVKGSPEVTIDFPATNPNEWHHLALTWENGNAMKSYQDGVLIDAKSFTNGATTHDAAIGQLNLASFFNGIIDEVRMYNRSLSSTEIANLYARG